MSERCQHAPCRNNVPCLPKPSPEVALVVGNGIERLSEVANGVAAVVQELAERS